MNLGAHEPHVQKPTGQDDDCGVDEEMAHARVEVDQPVEDADKDAREKDLWPKWGGGQLGQYGKQVEFAQERAMGGLWQVDVPCGNHCLNDSRLCNVDMWQCETGIQQLQT